MTWREILAHAWAVLRTHLWPHPTCRGCGSLMERRVKAGMWYAYPEYYSWRACPDCAPLTPGEIRLADYIPREIPR